MRKTKDRAPFRDLSPADVWTHPVPGVEEVMALPVSVPFAHTARALGMGREAAYAAIKTRTWPVDVPLRKIGRGRRAKRADLLRHLGIRDPDGAAAGGVSV